MKTKTNHVIVYLIFITFLVSNIYATPPLKFKDKNLKLCNSLICITLIRKNTKA